MYYKFLAGTQAPVSSVLQNLGFSIESYNYKIDEVNICENFDENVLHGAGYYFADEENILNFLGYGMTVYDVIIPEDAKVISFIDEVPEIKTDKIILTNPRKVDIDFVKDIISKGGKISDTKISGVLLDLLKANEVEIAKLIFDFIDCNDINILDQITIADIPSKLPYEYIDKYSNATDAEVITYLYNEHKFKEQTYHLNFSDEKYILSKISKKLEKPIKQIIDEYYKEKGYER